MPRPANSDFDTYWIAKFSLILQQLRPNVDYDRANPTIFLQHAFHGSHRFRVSGLRSELGLLQSLVSRYRINSNLMLVLVYIFVAEALLPRLAAFQSI